MASALAEGRRKRQGEQLSPLFACSGDFRAIHVAGVLLMVPGSIIVGKTEKCPQSTQEGEGLGDGIVGLIYNWLDEHTQRVMMSVCQPVCLALSPSLFNQSLG